MHGGIGRAIGSRRGRSKVIPITDALKYELNRPSERARQSASRAVSGASSCGASTTLGSKV